MRTNFFLLTVISIHAPRTGSDVGIPTCNTDKKISIHAPRTGSDGFNRRDANSKKISIHAPRTGSDHSSFWGSTLLTRFQSTLPARGATFQHLCGFARLFAFQSTLPARGATVSAHSRAQKTPYFNPRSPHGERRRRKRDVHGDAEISIHAPRTGSDMLPARRESRPAPISIHAPRTGSDIATPHIRFRRRNISIHAPRTGSDLRNNLAYTLKIHFNPRSPHGERRSRR